MGFPVNRQDRERFSPGEEILAGTGKIVLTGYGLPDG